MKQVTRETEPLLAAAAAGALGRIRKDREKVEPQIRPLLAHIEENLFDWNLSATSLKRQCGVRDNNLAVRFTAAVGKSPYAYIKQRRMETACRLLADTGLPVWRIAELVGYSGIAVFSRAFHRWSGVRPTVYRKESATRTGISSPSRHCAGASRAVKVVGVPGATAADGAEIPKWRPIKRWPEVGEGRCHRLEIWLPAEIHSRLESALARSNIVSGDDQRRLTERDVMIEALVDWLQAIPPPDERSRAGTGFGVQEAEK